MADDYVRSRNLKIGGFHLAIWYSIAKFNVSLRLRYILIREMGFKPINFHSQSNLQFDIQ